jgi:hypothetical protein
MRQRTLLTLGIAGATVLSGGIFAFASASAAPSTLAKKLGTTFHLDPAKVQTVIDQNRIDGNAHREASYEKRLTKAVTDQKLTAPQKDEALAEHTKLESEFTAAKAKTGADRKTAEIAVRAEAAAWAKAHTINEKWLGSFGHKVHRHPTMTEAPEQSNANERS